MVETLAPASHRELSARFNRTFRKFGSAISRSAARSAVKNSRPWWRTMPDTWIAAQCPLCGVKRSYLPSEIFRDKLSYQLGAKPARSVVL